MYQETSVYPLEVVARWVGWLSNGLSDYAVYRALNAARMLAEDKKPGVRRLACGDIFMRLFARCNLTGLEVRSHICDHSNNELPCVLMISCENTN